MQNLYTAATLIREQQMRKMATEINKGLINVEQAMDVYNVSTREHVIARIEALKQENRRKDEKQQPDNFPANILVA